MSGYPALWPWTGDDSSSGRHSSQGGVDEQGDAPLVLARIADFTSESDDTVDDPLFDTPDPDQPAETDTLSAFWSRLSIGGLVLAVGIFGFILGRATAPDVEPDWEASALSRETVATDPPAWVAPTSTAVEPGFSVAPPKSPRLDAPPVQKGRLESPGAAPMLVAPPDMVSSGGEISSESGGSIAGTGMARRSESRVAGDRSSSPTPTQTVGPWRGESSPSPSVTSNRSMAIDDGLNRPRATGASSGEPTARVANKPDVFGGSDYRPSSRPPVEASNPQRALVYPTTPYPTTPYPVPRAAQPDSPAGPPSPSRYY